MPAVVPVTIPVEEFTVAAPEPLVADHVPPGIPSANVVEDPAHTVVVPVIADGLVYTLKALVTVHPDLV